MSLALKKYRSITYLSQQQAWVAPGGGKLEFSKWVDNKIGDQRVIIDGFEIQCNFVVTVTTAALLLQDTWRFIDTLTVEQVDGVNRFNEVPGDALRICCYQYLGAERTREQYQVAVGAGQTVNFTFYVPMLRPYTEEEYEFCMPAEVLKLVRIGMARPGNLSLGTSVVTIASGAYYIVADCHLEPKGITKSYAVDQVTVNDLQAAGTTQISLNLGGRPHDMAIYLPGAKGGVTFTAAITQANLVGMYQTPQNTYPDLTARYSRERAYEPAAFGTTTQQPIRIDPFVPDPSDGSGSNASTLPRALALLLATGNHPDEGPVVDTLQVNFTEVSVPTATPRIVTRTVVPRNPTLTAMQGKRAGKIKGQSVNRSGRKGGPKIVAPGDVAYQSTTLT